METGAPKIATPNLFMVFIMRAYFPHRTAAAQVLSERCR